MNPNSCAFTGHRPKSFPWQYDETAHDCILLKETLAVHIAELANSGVTDFLSGMAQGTDCWSAELVLELRKKIPALKLHCILPCKGQECKWTASAQEQYHSILKQADSVVFVSRHYYNGCMLERNRYLVEHASIVLAVYNGDKQSGTASTLRYAYKKGRGIYMLHPISREMTHIRSSLGMN